MAPSTTYVRQDEIRVPLLAADLGEAEPADHEEGVSSQQRQQEDDVESNVVGPPAAAEEVSVSVWELAQLLEKAGQRARRPQVAHHGVFARSASRRAALRCTSPRCLATCAAARRCNTRGSRQVQVLWFTLLR